MILVFSIISPDNCTLAIENANPTTLETILAIPKFGDDNDSSDKRCNTNTDIVPHVMKTFKFILSV